MGFLENAVREYGRYRDRSDDPSTPPADKALIYFKDGKLHQIDSAGTVTDLTETGEGGGGGGGLSAYTRITRTAGNYDSLSSTTLVPIDGSNLDIVLDAAAGDIIEYGAHLTLEPSGSNVHPRIDVATVVSGSAVTFLSNEANPGAAGGIPGFGAVSSGVNSSVGGTIMIQLAAGDIDGSTVTLRPYYRVNSGSVTIRGNTGIPLSLFAANLGAV